MTPTNPTNTSPKQLEANRTNSQSSTGPATDAGKDKIRFNAVKHGVCSQAILLPNEDKEAFAFLGQRLNHLWTPSTEIEKAKIVELQECQWRLDRIRKAESSLLALGTLEQWEQFSNESDPDLRRALAEAAAWRANAKQFSLFRRHENALIREKSELEGFLTGMLQLRVQSQRAQQQKDEGKKQVAAASFTPKATLNDLFKGVAPKNGFVPHTAPNVTSAPSEISQIGLSTGKSR